MVILSSPMVLNVIYKVMTPQIIAVAWTSSQNSYYPTAYLTPPLGLPDRHLKLNMAKQLSVSVHLALSNQIYSSHSSGCKSWSHA